MINLLLASVFLIVKRGEDKAMSTVPESVDTFFSQYRIRKYTKGQILILNGDNTEFVYNLVKGRVKQYDVTYRGDEIILNVFKPPSFFPMSLAINKNPNLYTYEAETNIEIRQAPANRVVEFLKENPEITFELLSRVYKGSEVLLSRMAHLMASSAKSRLMFELLISCQRFGEQNKEGYFILAMNETDLGARAGLSRETVSREMKKLERDNLVAVKSGEVIVYDLADFEEKLGKVV